MVGRELRRRGSGVGDALLTLGLVAVVLGATTASGMHQTSGRMLDAGGYLWLTAAALPLLVRRRFPLVVFAVSAALAVAYYGLSNSSGGPAILLPAVALFALTRLRGPVLGSGAGTALLLALYLADLLATGDWLPDTPAAGFVAGVAAVIGIATAVRNRVAAVRAGQERVAEHEHRLAEQERLRIAREVHDVVAHSLAMINVRAGVAAHVADRRPEQAKQALHDIKDVSASALTDLRATLAALGGTEDRTPAPGLTQVSELVEHVEAAGLTVRLHGKPGELPAAVDSAAYRILQESLTNVVRHANRAGTVDVHLRSRDGRFTLRVRDHGTGVEGSTIGNGLRGMRERVEALGGTLHAGAADGGGFEVRAELPLPRDGGR